MHDRVFACSTVQGALRIFVFIRKMNYHGGCMSLRSEEHVLAIIDRHFPSSAARLRVGRGDDCCVVATPSAVCVSTDLFMEDVHFRRSTFTIEEVGWKALAVNLSDLAACGASPIGFSLGLGLPNDADETLVNGLFTGMASLAQAVDIPLTGGDLSKSEKLHLCITVFGDAEKGLLQRRSCSVDDRLFLLGEVGLSRTGFAALETLGRKDALTLFPEACAAHLCPLPLIEAGLELKTLQETYNARVGLMDVSDGLLRDIPRLIGTYGADLSVPEIPQECRRWAVNEALDPVYEVFVGGEDYALLGTCEPSFWPILQRHLSNIQELGIVTQTPGLRLHGMPLSGGFDHFAMAGNVCE